MINYFNFRQWNDGFLITNDIGCYSFLTKAEFYKFCTGKLKTDDPKYKELTDKYFILDKHVFVASSIAADKVRFSRLYLQHSTSLFMLVLTNECNMHCLYCQAQSSNNQDRRKMDYDTARKSVNIILQTPCREIMIEFQGGEPLLNFDVIKFIVEYVESCNTNHKVYYSIVTNASLLTQEIMEYFEQHQISVSLSIDGDRTVQEHNRPMNNGKSNYSCVLQHISSLKRKKVLAGAVMTTTRFSLDKTRRIINTYLELGFEDIFIRPLTPLGFAKEHWKEIGYSAEEFSAFYSEALDYIIAKNKAGIRFRENHAVLFLNKIVNQDPENYMELRSPCGSVLGQMAFNYDGRIYTCDEGRMLSRMGKEEFCLGNVLDSSFEDLVKHPICATMCRATILESIPGCCDCIYMPYCGVCPATTFATENDVLTRTFHNYRCGTYKGILDAIFKNLQIPENRVILESWI